MKQTVRYKHTGASVRRPEKWFRRLLWLVALVFASFLIGLGGKIVGDLPKAGGYRPLDDYLGEMPAYRTLKPEAERLETQQQENSNALEQAQLQLDKLAQQTQSEQSSLNNWLAARSATEQSEQNPEVISRTRRLDQAKAAEREAQQKIDGLRQRSLDTEQQLTAVRRQIAELEEQAAAGKLADDNRTDLKIFLYRLAFTLPLLLAAGWLFARKRQSRWWPFVWGFILFALFAFFVELVPYLPSYGGYVRYIVGIAVTVLAGRYAILAMNRYLERKQAEEALPEQQRQAQLDYDQAQLRLSQGICPGCERPLDLKQPDLDFCPHCGIGLFDRCGSCQTRKSTFSRYCFRCGSAAARRQQPETADSPNQAA